jgi:hypothetical protein
MRGSLLIAFILWLGMAGPALAVSFDFVTTIDGANPYSYEGRMTVSNTFCRVDITRGAHPLFNPDYSIISQRSGRVILVLDHKHKTYFSRETNGMNGPLSTVRGFTRSSAAHASIRVHGERAAAEPGHSRRMTRYAVHVTYDLSITVEEEKFPATVDISGSIWTLDGTLQTALPWGMQFAAKTGFPDIDRTIAARLPHEVPVRQLITVSRRIGDGPRVSETMTITTSNFSEAPSPPEIFGAPADYRPREPNFNFGGP